MTARPWLRTYDGRIPDEIDPDAARLLGLKVDGQEPAMLRDDHEVEQVLLALTQLALASKQPFLLCIDQVENLESTVWW